MGGIPASWNMMSWCQGKSRRASRLPSDMNPSLHMERILDGSFMWSAENTIPLPLKVTWQKIKSGNTARTPGGAFFLRSSDQNDGKNLLPSFCPLPSYFSLLGRLTHRAVSGMLDLVGR